MNQSCMRASLALVTVVVAACGGGQCECKRPHAGDQPPASGTATAPNPTTASASSDAASAGAAGEPVAKPPGMRGKAGYFPASAPWYENVAKKAKAANSDAVIAWLGNAGGWGRGRMQIDFSIHVQRADASVPMRTFTKTDEFYAPDCDHVPVPVPPGGALEGETGYECTSDGDCHLIVVHEPTGKLYEMWRADIRGDVFKGGCLAVWDLSRDYGNAGRGKGCTSADAAGFPIAPLLFTADEVKAGAIEHAIRFILPNKRIRKNTYVAPATHATGAAKGGVNAPPYGARLRLRADYPLASLPNEGARVVARAMQKYGIMLADGGNIALTAQDDRGTTAKWSGLLGSRDLQALKVSDFEVVDSGPAILWDKNCTRSK